MSANHYNNKKLAPFKKQRELLAEELRKLQQEYVEEEKLNDFYFDEISRIERDYELLLKSIEKHQSHNAHLAVGNQGQSQGADDVIEQNVIITLEFFLLHSSKKEQLQDLQEEEIHKVQLQNSNLVMTQTQPQKQQKDQKQQQLQQIQEEEPVEDGYYINLKVEQDQLLIKVPGSITTFKELKKIVKTCCMAEEREIFYTDQMGNLLQDDMDILTEIYPPIYELLRNYQPTVEIRVIKNRKREDRNQQTEIDLQFETLPNFFSKTQMAVRNIKNAVNWSLYLAYITNFKDFIESFLFMIMLILYAMVEINEKDFFINSQLLLTMQNEFAISNSFISPIYNISGIMLHTIPSTQDNKTLPTFPLRSGLLIQSLVAIDDFNDCHILNNNQRDLFLEKNESCLEYDVSYTDGISGKNNNGTFDSTKYNSQFDGYVWELNMTTQDSFNQSYIDLIESDWVKYNKKSSKFIFNAYNSPSQRVVQIIINTIYLFNDPMLNYNTVQMEIFNLSEVSDQTLLYNQIIFYIGIVLLISSFFGKNLKQLDFFGLYFPGTQNNIIVIYTAYVELLGRKKKLAAKKRELPPNDIRELEQKALIISEYIVINLKILYITIRIPLIFDIIYILCQFGIVVKDNIDAIYRNALKSIDVHSDQFQDTTALITPLFVSRIYSAILILFFMISIVRFLGNRSPYLKCYGLVMIRFNSQSWFLLFVLVYIISICALAWSITLQGKLIHHDNFFWTFIGLLRCTLKYGMHNDIADQGFYNTYAKDISYSFETRYIQYLIIITISFIMIPIFISLMTEQVHNTKIEAKQKMLELQKQITK